MELILSTLQALPTGIGSFLLLLGLLVFVHELGHFAAAKYYGVRVETFSLGFGKKLLKFKRGDTTYCLSLIPLGGYVKMYGDDPTQELPEDQKQFAFLHKPLWPRFAIVLAGPMMNLVFAILLFFLLGTFGEKIPGTQIGDIRQGTAAYVAGFRSGDVINEIGGQPVQYWKEVKDIIETNAGRELAFTVKRVDGDVTQVRATPQLIQNPFIFSTRSEIGSIEGLELESRAPMVGVSDRVSPAGAAGLGPVEWVETINGKTIRYARDIEPALREYLTVLPKESERDPKAIPLELSVRALQDTKGQEPPARTVTLTVDATQLDFDKPLAPQIGMWDTETFLLSVKKGSPGLSITSAAKESPATAAGLKNGDHIVAIDGKPIKKWEDVLNAVKSYDEKAGALQITYRRAGEETTVSVVPELTEIPTPQGGLDKRYAIGIVPALLSVPNQLVKLNLSFGRAILYGFEQSWEYTKLIGMSLLRLIQAQVSPRNIGGVITIGRVASQSFEAGWDVFVKTMAVISINLFLLNLLPVPVLDGGHLVFFTIEAIQGAPLSLRKLEIAQQVGVLLLLSLMVFALFNDITHWISSW